MYEEFYGLSAKPFSLLPDADFLFMSSQHRRVISLLEYGMETESGFIAITGEVGSGKTTVIRRFLKTPRPNLVVGVITNPSALLGRLLGWIALAFDLKERGSDDMTIYNAFIDFLLAQYAKGKRVILIIDEAQNLPAAMLEELRMLSNVNNERDLLLQIVLVGQPELVETLKRNELRQFVQRIAVHCHLGLLTPADTAAYIRFRLAHVGGSESLCDDEACALVHHFTGGVPRLINLLCDQALVYGYSEDMKTISLEMIAAVVVDRSKFGLSPYRNVPETISLPSLRSEIRDILVQIRMGKRDLAVSA